MHDAQTIWGWIFLPNNERGRNFGNVKKIKALKSIVNSHVNTDNDTKNKSKSYVLRIEKQGKLNFYLVKTLKETQISVYYK